MVGSVFSFAFYFLYYTDFLNELLKSRKKKAASLKVGKSKAKINDFDISDDETSKLGRTKKVSFLKTKRITSPSGDTTTSETHENELPNSSISQHNDYKNSLSSQHSTNVSEDNTQFKNSEADSPNAQITSSLSYQPSEDTLLDMPLPLPSDSSVTESQGAEERSFSVLEESSHTPQLPAADLKNVSSAGALSLLNAQVTRGTFRVTYKLLLFR